jgi:hypothetical protein
VVHRDCRPSRRTSPAGSIACSTAAIHLGVIVDSELRGHVMLLPSTTNALELANFLHQSIRNRGIGTAINRIALDIARERAMKSVWLCVEPFNRAAVRSYEKAGFKVCPVRCGRRRSRWRPRWCSATHTQVPVGSPSIDAHAGTGRVTVDRCTTQVSFGLPSIDARAWLDSRGICLRCAISVHAARCECRNALEVRQRREAVQTGPA